VIAGIIKQPALSGAVALCARAALGAAIGFVGLGTISFGATFLAQLGVSALCSRVMSDW